MKLYAQLTDNLIYFGYVSGRQVLATEEHTRLFQTLFNANYSHLIRPVRSQDTVTVVHMLFFLAQVIQLVS